MVALDPTTGAILALWSNPSYDPNPLAAHDQNQVRSYWQAENANTDQPLLAASFRRRFFPGSTFKMITASAVYDKRPDLATKAYPQLPALPLPQTGGQVLRNFGGEVCGGPLPDLFRVSCNSGFAAIGLDLGAQALADEATSFGFDQTPPLDLPGGGPVVLPRRQHLRPRPAGTGQVGHRPAERPGRCPSGWPWWRPASPMAG